MARLAFIVATLMLATIGLSVADVPNIVGNWSGSFASYEKGTGYVNAPAGALTMTISEQKGRLFTGNLSLNFSSTKTIKAFSGIIALDNKTLYMAESDKGYDIGTVISNDTIELDYLEDGANGGTSIDTFHRTK
jgi:hypothetical protein